MKFDFYVSLSPQPSIPTVTTLDALQAATWGVMPDGTYYLTWDDHTEYADAKIAGDGDTWTCALSFEDGEWTFDFEHDSRAGLQDSNGTGLDSSVPIEVVQAAAKRRLANWIERWTQSADDDCWAAADRDD